jgi:hypothetical protein
MTPEVRWIDPNDIPLAEWPTWTPAGPEEELQWFHLGIGPSDDPGAELFQVAVATPKGLLHGRRLGKDRALVVPRFEPAAVERAIRDFVSACDAPTWAGIVDLLRTRMRWEYEGWRD